ncbi:MAG TPA: DUF2723 domain-containing protein [Polyangiales bacterium]|nr:DUF2723 domain-containing protein [Polyangiales bacterium]
MWLAFGVPFVAYVLTSGGLSYWLDSGEFVAASMRLDIAHPPGHPLSQLWGKLFTLLPLGSITWRVAVGQAFATALASLGLCLAVGSAIERLELEERAAWAIAVLGAWLAALTYGLWFQAVRAEVYALQTLCMSAVLAAIAKLESQSPVRDARPLYVAALALGFGLANHHLIAFLVAPALLPCVIRVVRARGVRPLLLGSGFGLLALLTYVYLPARAIARPAIDLGDPRSLANIAWVISARVYSQNLHLLDMEPMSQRFSEVAIIAVENFHGVCVIAALVGLYLALRHPGTRRHGLFFGLLLVVDGGVRAWMGSVRANPDILGYLAPMLMALAALAALFVASVVWAAQTHAPYLSARISRFAWLLPLLALLHAPVSLARSSLARFAAPEAFDEPRLRSLPPRAVVVESTPQTSFRHWELDAVDVVRPDVIGVPLSFLRYPGTGQRLAEAAPPVANIIQRYLDTDSLHPSDLLALAQSRPVFVEMDTHYPPRAYRILTPSKLMYRVLTSPTQIPDAKALEHAQDATFRKLYADVGADLHEVETARQLLWIDYMDALYFSSLGGRDIARKALVRALALHPNDTRLHKLAGALRDPRQIGPLDVTPYLDF